jgi:hypothetical protein
MPRPERPQGVSLEALASALSEPRLEAYRLHADEPVRAVLGRYRWNNALGMSLLPGLGLLEVALRNNLHRVLTGHFRTAAWYELAPSALAPREQEAVATVRRAQRQPAEPGGLVDELGFSFWTALLGTDYEQRLWPRLLAPVFPHMPRHERTRAKVARRFHDLRRLRNRISHHQPIHQMNKLAQLDDELHEALGWLSPALLWMLPVGEDFREVHARGSGAYEVDPT